MANFDQFLNRTEAWYNRLAKRINNNRLYQKWQALTESKRLKKRVQIRQHDIMDCGAACLASVAVYYNLSMPIARIRQLASTDKKGTNLLGLIEAANQMGFSAKGVKGAFENLFEIPTPTIAHVLLGNQLQHYVVIYKVTDSFIEVMDPGDGYLHQLSHDDFKKIWTRILVLLAPNEQFIAGDKTVSVEKRFSQLLKPHKGMLLQVLLGAVVYTILGLSTSIFLQKIVDNVLPEDNRNLLNLMGVVMVVIIFLQVFINHARTLITLKTGQQIDARLILGYYKHLLKLPQQFFDSMRVGEIISRINDAVKIRSFINEVLVMFAVNIFILIFSFALMFTYYWKLALIMLTIVPLFALIYKLSDRLNRTTQRKLMEDAADLQTQLVESVNAIPTIKRFGLEDFANFKTETRFINMLKTVFRSATNSLWVGNFSSLVSTSFTVILLWAGSAFVLDKIITPGELLSFYSIIGYFMSPVAGLIGMNKTLQDARIAADRLFEIMDMEQEPAENRAELTPNMIGNIHFKDVHFRYGSRATVFEGLDLNITKGKITAIVGESGSGKTTLLSLMQNIYTLQSGSIFIGDFDIQYVTNESLRRMVSVVPQDVHLFAGNVTENIAIGDLEPDLKRVLQICRQLEITDFIERLPNGFNTFLGENGTNLSGGQRQRLAIARALYRDPEILILDEATSSLDSESESHVQNAIALLRERQKTIIVIAHRLSTVMNADKIIVLQTGKLVEEGTHHELMAQQGQYFKMWQKQFPTEDVILARQNKPRKSVKSKASAEN
ncbi:bacteriocin-processing peptidase. Cysteine peptidase. MEROPS family C39 [Mucilaginibacter gossypiicola]|uniref:Bacteriocin-processing peptidase. Cysteine peptidase. MEROPS family C39 n=1 Tax=Mucilaginibacter gossypiicola TaxID=551995 RepID=A0A1H8B272_9SPHI|nr:peptidase domain-containing ABC transporter [Mucilaginibacter gossypiicola]SEM76836.1 bacteriocin-processing peptidase. Cysteine peptidase. MEROPS family C39 [Mucilaginibacter gossypiicola]